MKTVIGHLRGNAVAYLALFVAIGGTSYAAVGLPRGSVGAKQIRNHSITPVKFDGRSIAGYVGFWARIDQTGRVLASSKAAQTSGWSSGTAHVFIQGDLPRNCLAFASVSPVGGVSGYVEIASTRTQPGRTELVLVMIGVSGATQPLPIDVAEICP